MLIATEKAFCIVTYKLNASYEHIGQTNSEPEVKTLHKRSQSEKILEISKKRQSGAKDNKKDLREKATVAYRWNAMEHETIKYINFVDDERPQFIFIIIHSSKTNI